MLTFLAIVHLFIGVCLVIFVLMQDSKGSAMGALGGGSSANTFFGSSGATNFLATTTKWLAVAFAISCLTLTYITSRKTSSVMDTLPTNAGAPVTTPANPEAPANTPADKGQPAFPATPPPETK
jgi:preprotein translocase subunit SecG